MGYPAGRRIVRRRIQRRLLWMAVGLVAFPALALAVIVWGINRAEIPARDRALADAKEQLQEQTLELAKILSKHEDLFRPEPAERYLPKLKDELINGYQLKHKDAIDGSCTAWRLLKDEKDYRCKDEDARVPYDRREFLFQDNPGYDPKDFSFSLVRAIRSRDDGGLEFLVQDDPEYLYLFVRVVDDNLQREPSGFNRSDHLRLVARTGSDTWRFVVTLRKEGEITTYQVDTNWQSTVPETNTEIWGNHRDAPKHRPYGKWKQFEGGYEIELRLPLERLEGDWRESELGLAVVDFDDEDKNGPSPGPKIVWVVPYEKDSIGFQSPDSKEFQADLNAFRPELAERAIAVFDKRSRLLFIGSPKGVSLADALRLSAEKFDDAESGFVKPPANTLAYQVAIEASGETLLGFAVELKPTPADSPALRSLIGSIPWTAFAFFSALLVLTLMLSYTRRISRRILALTADVSADQDSDDEIGELSRKLTELTERDRAHRGYLEQLTSVLGHEISGRLNTINMAIDELPRGDLAHRASHSAVESIQSLIQDLREATSLEQALASGERSEVDLVFVIRKYADADALSHPDETCLVLELPDTTHPICVVETRIELLLDRLVENARDFSDDGLITLSLTCSPGEATIRISNTGSQLPVDIPPAQLFAPGVSTRNRTQDRHLGLGLYVTRLIAEQHGGDIHARNDAPNRVVFEVTLRSAREQATQAN